VETKARETRMVKAKRKGSKRGSRKEKRGKSREKTEKVKEGKNNRSKEDSGGMGNLR